MDKELFLLIAKVSSIIDSNMRSPIWDKFSNLLIINTRPPLISFKLAEIESLLELSAAAGLKINGGLVRELYSDEPLPSTREPIRPIPRPADIVSIEKVSERFVRIIKYLSANDNNSNITIGELIVFFQEISLNKSTINLFNLLRGAQLGDCLIDKDGLLREARLEVQTIMVGGSSGYISTQYLATIYQRFKDICGLLSTKIPQYAIPKINSDERIWKDKKEYCIPRLGSLTNQEPSFLMGPIVRNISETPLLVSRQIDIKTLLYNSYNAIFIANLRDYIQAGVKINLDEENNRNLLYYKLNRNNNTLKEATKFVEKSSKPLKRKRKDAEKEK